MPFLMDLGGSLGASPYQGALARLEDMEEQKADLIRSAVSKSLAEIGINDFTFRHETGLLVDSLSTLEEDGKMSLIVMGKRGENANMAKGHLGGNLERVVRSTKLPCFVANRKYCDIKRIVIAYDDGPSSRNALQWLVKSGILKGLELHVVSVNLEAADNNGTIALEAARQELERTNTKAHYQLLTGQVDDVISDYIAHEDADLLVMGAYGHSRIRDLFIGSTTTELLRRCRIACMLFH